MVKLSWRPDIEGLRAVAVLLVIAAHIGTPSLAGGFVGVDVFFVLSGYLITALLTQELRMTGRIDFWMFYARRFRRLAPGLLLMLSVVCLFVAFALSPLRHPDQASASASASVWASNFYFAFRDMDYFGAEAVSNLFLHTWSLGVEEQFYLVWPLLLWLIFSGFRPADTETSALRRLKTSMALFFFVSLALCLWLTRAHPASAFYMMPARAWQFSLGALVWLTSPPPPPLSRAVMPARLFWNVLGWIGFLFVVLAALNYDGKTPYPGWRAIPPSLGAALMIAAGGRCNGVFSVTCLLSLKPMQALGRISYGWYLWHWPILTLSGVIYIQAGETTRLALALCALFLAAFSFRFVELPIRRNGALLRYPKRIVLGAICASLLMANFALSWNRRAEKARFDPLWTQIEEARSDLSELYAYGCDTWFFSAELTVCAFGDQRATHTAVLMGDSVGAQWFPALKPRFTQLGWRLLVLTKSSCPMVEKSFFYPRIGKEYTVCTEWRQRALDFLREQKPEQVFLGSAVSSGGFSDAEWTEGSRKVLAALSPYVGAITLIRGTPILPFNAPDCLADETFFTNFLAGENRCSAKPDDTRNEAVFAALRVAARDFPNTRLLDMNDAICPDGLCGAQRENLVVFRDNQHLTARFTAHLAEIFSNRLDALWADAKNQEIAE